jgi:hypothetical protein
MLFGGGKERLKEVASVTLLQLQSLGASSFEQESEKIVIKKMKTICLDFKIVLIVYDLDK